MRALCRLTRSPAAQAEDEEAVLAQAEEILEARKAQAAAKRPAGAPLMHAASFSNSISELPFFDANVTPFAPSKPGVYLRRNMLEEAKKAALQQVCFAQGAAAAHPGRHTCIVTTLCCSTGPLLVPVVRVLGTIATIDPSSRPFAATNALPHAGCVQSQHGQKAAKMLDSVLADVAKATPAPAMLTRAVSGMFLALHSEARHLVDLRLSGQRGALKAAPVEEGRGKRAIKVKGPRYSEGPAPPPSKRSRLTR